MVGLGKDIVKDQPLKDEGLGTWSLVEAWMELPTSCPTTIPRTTFPACIELSATRQSFSLSLRLYGVTNPSDAVPPGQVRSQRCFRYRAPPYQPLL